MKPDALAQLRELGNECRSFFELAAGAARWTDEVGDEEDRDGDECGSDGRPIATPSPAPEFAVSPPCDALLGCTV
jgi:hypothetical protein